MLYLEDLMEQLQELPPFIHENLASLENLDAQIEVSMDRLKDNVETLFSSADQMKPSVLETEFQALMEEGDNAIKKSDCKVQKVIDMKNTLEKYLDCFDNSIYQCKQKLNTDYAGAAELIEERVMKNDSERCEYTIQEINKPRPKQPLFKEKKTLCKDLKYEENLKPTSKNSNVLFNPLNFKKSMKGLKQVSETLIASSSGASSTEHNFLDQINSCPENSKSNVSSAVNPKKNQTAKKTKKKNSMQKNGINSKKITKKISIEETIHHSDPIASSSNVPFSEPIDSVDQVKSNVTSTVPHKNNEENIERNDNGKNSQTGEELYCICNQVAYDCMVACDNETCQYEWFHFDCVGISEQPIGDWYCAECIAKMKKRRKL